MQIKRKATVTQLAAATNGRNFRRFLLMEQFEAREIGARIRKARRERGLTQEDLAALASFSKRSLQDYEAGVTTPYRHLREISQLLKKPEEWLLYGEETFASLDEQRLREIIREEIAAALEPLSGRNTGNLLG